MSLSVEPVKTIAAANPVMLLGFPPTRGVEQEQIVVALSNIPSDGHDTHNLPEMKHEPHSVIDPSPLDKHEPMHALFFHFLIYQLFPCAPW